MKLFGWHQYSGFYVAVMVYEDLFARLNEVGYKNWLKAGYCLLKVKDGLCGFADLEMRSFHQTVINNNSVLQSHHTCRNNCRPRGTQFHPDCFLCDEWKNEILRHHTRPSCTIHWGNCRSWLWPTAHWELAKAFMPRGLTDSTKAEQCDAAALLNLFNFCDHFSFIDRRLLIEVIRCRNELMHSCEMRVTDRWMGHFQKNLEQLLLPLRHIPEVAAAGHQIQQVMSVDLSVNIPGADSVDGGASDEVMIESISQWENELLRESLKDLLDNSENEGNLTPVDLEKLQRLYRFLSSQKDLEEQFKTELQRIKDLGAGQHTAETHSNGKGRQSDF